jgi:hypothetical protein
LTADIAEGAITDMDGNPNAAFNGSYTVEGCPPSQYVITPGTDTIFPGTTDIGSHCDDCDTAITLPFTFTLYDQTYTSVNASSNGRLDFVVANEPGGYQAACLPPPPNVGPFDFSIFVSWTDTRTDFGLSGCSNFPGGNCGIFTATEGNSPDRIFHIEWRTVLFNDNDQTQNFEVRLFENNPGVFEVVRGVINNGGFGSSEMWVGGVQGNSGAGFLTQDYCNPPGSAPPSNVSATYGIPPCGTPSPTPTASPSVTPSATPSVTPSVTPTATPTVTPSVTPTPTPSATPSATPTPSVTPTPTATPTGCVFGFGYWKNHPEAWPVTELQLGNVTYTQEQLLDIMHEPVRGNGLVSLAHHLITAKLNVANGADPSCIEQTIADADALIGDLVVPPIGDGFLQPREVNALKDVLEDYNEGNLCAPSCDNSSPTPPPGPTPRSRPPAHPRPQP